MYKAHI